MIVLVDALVGDRSFAETLRARRTYDAARARLAAMQTENAALRDRMRRLAGDPRAIEALAREEMGFIRPGEVLFILKPTVGIKPAVGIRPTIGIKPTIGSAAGGPAR
jgi:cell division protein FtsB